MFTKARIKLTLYYLVIITAISLLFSMVVYRGFVTELRRGLRAQSFHYLPNGEQLREQSNRGLPDIILRTPFGILEAPASPDPIVEAQIFEEARNRLLLNLLFINLAILGVSGAGGYFLAGRTLAPIEEMMDEQKRFVGDASHELRTPLTALKTETEVALRDKKLDFAEAKRLLKSNLEEVDKMQRLANYLLALSRYQNDDRKVVFDEVDLAKVAGEAADKLAVLAKAKKIVIRRELKTVNARGNEEALGEVVRILLDNAIKYSHRGGKIIVRSGKEGKSMAVTEVQDFGIGIKASEIPYIFNRFYRADSSRNKERVDGYGLGLAIAKRIADLHKGKILVSSLPGQGSTFKLLLRLS